MNTGAAKITDRVINLGIFYPKGVEAKVTNPNDFGIKMSPWTAKVLQEDGFLASKQKPASDALASMICSPRMLGELGYDGYFERSEIYEVFKFHDLQILDKKLVPFFLHNFMCWKLDWQKPKPASMIIATSSFMDKKHNQYLLEIEQKEECMLKTVSGVADHEFHIDQHWIVFKKV